MPNFLSICTPTKNAKGYRNCSSWAKIGNGYSCDKRTGILVQLFLFRPKEFLAKNFNANQFLEHLVQNFESILAWRALFQNCFNIVQFYFNISLIGIFSILTWRALSFLTQRELFNVKLKDTLTITWRALFQS